MMEKEAAGGRMLSCLVASLIAVGLAACGGGATSSSPGGGSITVAVAVNKPPASMLNDFTKKTGIKVNWVTVGWDDLQTKIAAAASAHTYSADVTDVDWSKVGQYHTLKWFQNLSGQIDVPSWRKDMPDFDSFVVGGDVVGVPMDTSYTVTTVNSKIFQEAGITTMPTTIDEYTQDLKTIQGKHLSAHPLDIPFAAAEGLSTYWYQTTGAFGGHPLNAKQQPLFSSSSSPGYRAMDWMIKAYQSGLVPQENLNKTDTDGFNTQMAQGTVASVFSDYSGDVETIYDVASQSKVVGQVRYLPTAGANGVGPNFANPDGLGIPVTARNKQGALEFLNWFDSTDVQATWAGAKGSDLAIQGFPLPARVTALQEVVKSGKVVQAAAELDLLQHHVAAVFPGGAPAWYPDFSRAVYTNLHEAAAGHESVDAAIRAIADKANQLRSSG